MLSSLPWYNFGFNRNNSYELYNQKTLPADVKNITNQNSVKAYKFNLDEMFILYITYIFILSIFHTKN